MRYKVSLSYTGYGIRSNFYKRFIIDKDFTGLIKIVTDWTCSLLLLMLTEFVVLWCFAVVVILEYSAHFEGQVTLYLLLYVILWDKRGYFVLASYHLCSWVRDYDWLGIIEDGLAVLFQVTISYPSKVVCYLSF